MGVSTAPALPSQAHIDAKAPEPVVTSIVGRKHSFRGFSASSLSSLTLGRNQNKRSSLGPFSRSSSTLVTSSRESDSASEHSRPPSLITDNSSLTSASSRSPSPEPSNSISRLEAAFKNYSSTHSPNVLLNVLLPTLSLSRAKYALKIDAATRSSLPRNAQVRSSIVLSDVLDETDINVLFKWWNHLLLLSPTTSATFQAVYAIAAHPSLRDTVFWNAHYELTLSTTLSQPANILPSSIFASLLALGYIYHPPTSDMLRSLFADPTKIQSVEPWVKRAKNVEIFMEISKHVYTVCPTFDDHGVIAARLQEMLSKVITITTFPNNRLSNLTRLVATSEGVFAQLLETCLMRIAESIGVFDCVAVFYFLDVLSSAQLTRIDFWLEVLKRVMTTENHILLIRVFTFFYDFWAIFADSSTAIDLLLSRENWELFFVHWSGIVRDHYMRLITYKVCLTHPEIVRTHLLCSFKTSLSENCQLRDCLPSNPIPNKRLIIRPITIRPTLARQSAIEPIEAQNDIAYDESANLEQTTGLEGAAGFVKKKLGLFRGLFNDDAKDGTQANFPSSPPLMSRERKPNSHAGGVSDKHPAAIPATSTPADRVNSMPQLQSFKFVAEFVGKHWSLTSDSDAIKFLDSVMDAAREGRLPIHCLPLSSQSPGVSEDNAVGRSAEQCPRQIVPYELTQGRKKLWTRSLSEWSTLLDETDRFWINCGGRSLSSSASSGNKTARRINCPKLVVDFPRWFVQKSTQIAGDGVAERM